MPKDEILKALLEKRVVAVVRMTDAGKLLQVVEAIARGGVRAIEITMTVPGAVDIIRTLVSRRVPGSLVGAGTVLDAATADAVLDAGADFVVSPIADPAMIAACRRRDAVVIPGAFSPSEIVAAWKAGGDIIKVFPATALGPGYIRDLRGPLPHIRLMPTGGVTLENAREFIAAGACAVGLGTALLDRAAIAEGRWQALAEKAAALVASLK